jgi:hypothetical protein
MVETHRPGKVEQRELPMNLAGPDQPLSSPAQSIAEAVQAHRPTVLRQLPIPPLLDWAGPDGVDFDRLESRLRDLSVFAASTAPDAGGIVRYANPDSPHEGSTGTSSWMKFDVFTSEMLARSAKPEAPPLFTQVTHADGPLPELSALTATFEALLQQDRPGQWNLWFGSGGSRINTHYDDWENFYFVLMGSKRFQLFPPEQACNLYPAPREGGIGGVSGSLVDAWNPDAQAFPLYAEAQAHSLRYSLAAGDMLYLPARWWHNVASDGLNFSANYWWSPRGPRLDRSS